MTVVGMISALLAILPAKITAPSIPSAAAVRARGRIPMVASSAKSRAPRVLVATPSNAAIDEIIHRMVKDGVMDPHGRRRPEITVVRVGSGSNTSQKEVCCRALAVSMPLREAEGGCVIG